MDTGGPTLVISSSWLASHTHNSSSNIPFST